MRILQENYTLDKILESQRLSLGIDFNSYKNHCYRVFNFCLAFCKENSEGIVLKVSIAAAFHDLGIWANKTYDYIEPSKQLVREYLSKIDKENLSEEIENMIENHHKLSKYKANPGWLVEPFRRADWVDISMGRIKFGLPSAFISEVKSRFPNAGFHKLLTTLTIRQFKTHPFNPLPMIKL
ncbi:MAG: HD domain-containing protein [Nitrospiraceae bacterium]|nr:HD domain-containing protein [Nitrospiraceae bacterium]